jgi:DNA-binding transcriptional ArsR family regulator
MYFPLMLINDSAKERHRLSAAFAALADPTRRGIVARLADGPATPGELAAPLAMSAPALSRHLKVLERAGLIARGREGQRRPCRLAPGGLEAVEDWLNDLRRTWEARLDRLEAHLRAEEEREHGDGNH